jgi:geranylgeranyl diphosphate synthase type I
VLVGELAQRYLPALDDYMRTVVDSLPDSAEFLTMLRYPLGWVQADGTQYSGSTGKRIRPLLLLLCAEAAGGDWRAALPAAAAVEFLHNFSLIHDDIQDDSPTRHNRPTVWKVWNVPQAINAGDSMFALAYEALLRLRETSTPEITLSCWSLFNHTNFELTRGQHLDMRFENQPIVALDEYLSMVSGKTAALLAASAQMGALIGSRDAEIAVHYGDFGLNLGIAFQIHDDILGIWGDTSMTGKSASTDILARKKSLPILYGLERSVELRAVYQRQRDDHADVEDAMTALNAVGALDYARTAETDYYERALQSVRRSGTEPSQSFDNLLALTHVLFQRAS